MSINFIGGVNRSGTTLLQSILCSDSTTNPLIHEASYFRSIIEAYSFGKVKFEEHNKYYFSSVNEMRDFTAKWAKGFLDHIRNRYPDASNLVLKHPPLTPRFPDIFELLTSIGEDPYFYIIIRDPRDVAASLVQVGEKLRKKGDQEGNTLPRNMALLGNYYMQCYMPALSTNMQNYKDRITIIKYEDLVKNPEFVINNIRTASGLQLKGLQPDNNWKDDHIDYDSLKKDNNAWLSNLWGKGLSTSKVGSYKKILTSEEIRQLETVCSGPLLTFGYTNN